MTRAPDQHYTVVAVDFEHLRPIVQREAHRLTGDADEAQDLVQECLLVLHAHCRDLNRPEAVAAWCRTVVRNIHRARLRRHWYTELVGLPTLPETSDDPWATVDARIMAEAALSCLPARVGRAMRSFYLGGHSIAAIGATEGRPVGTIKRWLHEGREALRVSSQYAPTDGPRACILGSNWLDDARRHVIDAVTKAGYSPLACELAEDAPVPGDAAVYILGEQAGCRTGLELLLAIRGTEATASTPVLLFGPARQTAILAAWQAGADAYLTDPSSADLVGILRKLATLPEQ